MDFSIKIIGSPFAYALWTLGSLVLAFLLIRVKLVEHNPMFDQRWKPVFLALFLIAITQHTKLQMAWHKPVGASASFDTPHFEVEKKATVERDRVEETKTSFYNTLEERRKENAE